MKKFKQIIYLITRSVLLITFSVFFVFSINIANANCETRFINPITDICWDCLFPITIGNINIVSSDYPDTENPSFPIEICLTEGLKIPRIGLNIGFWGTICDD